MGVPMVCTQVYYLFFHTKIPKQFLLKTTYNGTGHWKKYFTCSLKSGLYYMEISHMTGAGNNLNTNKQHVTQEVTRQKSDQTEE